ncbi:deoxynucleotidyltransferase terminal-interacting protein 2-like [Liolophura sinensis]|uniref:deoxynucleotidyltransferase terminal-interacting protein 2-like n=1 Tax=Liolophura sinensis TaxID=3198878 RepID=UPI0031588521
MALEVEEIFISSGSDSDSDIEGLVDMVFSKMKWNLSKKGRSASKTMRETVLKNTTTTTTRRTRSSTRKLSLTESETDNTSTKRTAEASSALTFFIDTKPTKHNLSGIRSDSDNELEPNSSSKTVKVTSECDLCESDKNNIVAQNAVSQSAKGEDGASSPDDEETAAAYKMDKKEKKKSAKAKSKGRVELSSSLQTEDDLSDLYVNVRSFHQPQEHKPQIDNLLLGGRDQEILKRSVITPDFEKKDRALPYTESVRKLKMQRRKERAMTKGNNWYNMPATELTEERKNDLKVLQMRHALDPKRFYRANDLHTAPKYFQFGTVVESKADFYSSRIPKKQRKSTLVDELFADAEFRRYNKRKYAEIQEAKRLGTGPYQKMRFPKKKKKTKK